MAWIESHQELAQHPKTKRFAKRLNISLPTAIGHLHLLWWWALDYADDGNLADYTEDEIAEAAAWEGDPSEFVNAMLHCGVNGGFGFLEPDEDGNLHIHDWSEYAGRLLARRKAAVKRTQEWRERYSHVTHNEDIRNASTVPNRTVPNQTESMAAVAAPSTPIEVPSIAEVRELFDYFKNNIQPKALKFTPRTLRARIKSFGLEQCKVAIDHFSLDDFSMGNNAHRGADWFFASDKRVEQYINMTPRKEVPRASPNNGRADRPGPDLPNYGGKLPWEVAT